LEVVNDSYMVDDCAVLTQELMSERVCRVFAGFELTSKLQSQLLCCESLPSQL